MLFKVRRARPSTSCWGAIEAEEDRICKEGLDLTAIHLVFFISGEALNEEAAGRPVALGHEDY